MQRISNGTGNRTMKATRVKAQPLPMRSIIGTMIATAPAPNKHLTRFVPAEAIAGIPVQISVTKIIKTVRIVIELMPHKKVNISGAAR